MKEKYDVIVCGGGPGGIAAAVAAARMGTDVLLLERYGFLGGGATAMLVNPFMTFFAGGKQIIHGIFQEMIDDLKDMNAYGTEGTPWAFDTEAFKIVAENLCQEAGVDILFHTFLADAEVKNEKIETLTIATKDGLKKLTANIFIDSTGDGDLAFFAGASIEKGRSKDNLTQPMTLNFRMAEVDIEKMPSRKELSLLYIKAKNGGLIKCPREDILFFLSTQPNVVHFNQTRVIRHDATDPMSMSDAEIEGRRQAWEISRWLINEIPGYERSYLQQTACQIGVRESRRVMGNYVLTMEDLLSARKFDDVIACGSYNIDIHNPDGEGTTLKKIKPGQWYDIPYSSLIPQGINNLLIGSRCISTTHEAHSAIRVIPIVFAIGQAAGVAAGFSVRTNIIPSNLNYKDIQKYLLEQGATLGDL